MTNKVKPFYIKITDDMTPQMVQDAFDKCVDAGAVAFEGIYGCSMRHSYSDAHGLCFVYFGVDFEGDTYLSKERLRYGKRAQEITLDQLDEWLGLGVEREWDGWDSDGYADVFPKGKGIDVLAFIDAKVNGINGPKGRWVEAKTVCCCYHQNGGAQVVVEFNGRNYAISALTYLKKPETPEQKAERERLEEQEKARKEALSMLDEMADMKSANVNIDCTYAIAVTVKSMIELGYRKQ